MSIYHALAADKAGLEGAWRGYHYFQNGGKGHRLPSLGGLPITFSDVAMAYVSHPKPPWHDQWCRCHLCRPHEPR